MINGFKFKTRETATSPSISTVACVPGLACVMDACMPPLCMDCAIASNFPSDEIHLNTDHLLLVTSSLWQFMRSCDCERETEKNIQIMIII